MAMNISVESQTNYAKIENSITGTRLGFLTISYRNEDTIA